MIGLSASNALNIIIIIIINVIIVTATVIIIMNSNTMAKYDDPGPDGLCSVNREDPQWVTERTQVGHN